jgi:hypothetical protein
MHAVTTLQAILQNAGALYPKRAQPANGSGISENILIDRHGQCGLVFCDAKC